MKSTVGIFLWIIFLSSMSLACSKRPTYSNFAGLGPCGNGIQDRGEVGIDCGGNCPSTCTNIRYLEGEIFRRLPLNPYNEYVVTGPFIIRDKASLEIPAGTRLKVQADAGAYIAVMQGGSIFAWGTAQKPITITSNAPNPKPGDWGGLIICGQAPIGQDQPQLSPLGYYFYGGNQQFDTSGYLKYVKIEYAGAAYDSLQHFNAISFYGTGAYTSVDHLWIDNALGTAVEINGGTMPLDDLYVSGSTTAVRVKGHWQANSSQWFLDAAEQYGIAFYNNLRPESQSTTPTILNHITLNQPGQSGFYFYDVPQLLELNTVLIHNTPLGLNFTPHEPVESWIASMQLDQVFIENSSQSANLIYYETLLNSPVDPVPPSLKQIPHWIRDWPNP